ncbi:glycosyltransferase family 2 protein [Rhizosphaericola mali]|uniref:Glycosyltransferase family 2 protein n=1 Tax=Rhizosphaericola mali TaxID=2545455 RepID=A0A5P2G7Y0_9BACT|nr:glycosyltransferase family 2 protein [Rhizosphaericola mali]QES89313.1 glycosyltransferase family 2 protein [Rhizosphaericola mali]
MKIIYIIIVTYNGEKWLKKCLESSFCSDIPVKIVIIDNGSTDNTLKIVESFSGKRIHFIQTGENLGFGKANNLGINYALEQGAEFVYLLNQDAYLDANTISGLVKIMESDYSYGILSPMQYNGDGSRLDKNFEDIYTKRSTKSPTSSDVLNVKFVMAAHWLIRCSMLQMVGLFDPLFSHYGEDNDLINRFLYRNYLVGISVNYKAYHDRDDRKIDEKKQIDVAFQGLIAQLTNPGNKNILLSLFSFFCKSPIIYLIKGMKIENCKYQFLKIFTLFKLRKKILYTRRKNKLAIPI